jgi:hypothetical protein
MWRFENLKMRAKLGEFEDLNICQFEDWSKALVNVLVC